MLCDPYGTKLSLVGGKVNKEMGEHQGEEEDTPVRPANTNGDNKRKEDSNKLTLLHRNREGVTGCDEGQMQGCRFRLLTKSGGRKPMLSTLKISSSEQQRLFEIVTLPINGTGKELGVVLGMTDVHVKGLDEQLHGGIEIISVRAEEDPVEGGQFLANLSVVDVTADDGNNSLTVLDSMVNFPVADLRLDGIGRENKEETIRRFNTLVNLIQPVVGRGDILPIDPNLSLFDTEGIKDVLDKSLILAGVRNHD